jgi:hypothetical protein
LERGGRGDTQWTRRNSQEKFVLRRDRRVSPRPLRSNHANQSKRFFKYNTSQ